MTLSIVVKNHTYLRIEKFVQLHRILAVSCYPSFRTTYLTRYVREWVQCGIIKGQGNMTFFTQLA